VETRSSRTRRLLIFAVVGLLVVAVAWWFLPYQRGMLVAWADGFSEHDEIKVYGLPFAWDREYARLLRERYGVTVNFVAGCVVTRDLQHYADGYNAVSEARVRSRFGKDVFGECANEARGAWEQAHPKAGR
jgi:hypothetical protein